MNHTTPAKLEQLRDAWEAAKEALLADPGIPCRGQVYTYQRGTRRYYKWQHCHGGRRTQRTVDLASMEALVEGMAARARVEQRLAAYYAAGEAYLLACAKGGDRPAQAPPVKKNISAREDEVWQAAQRAGAAQLARAYAVWDEAEGSQPPACPQCGATMHHLRRAPRYIVTRLGEVRVVRHVYYCRTCQRTHAPLDAALALDQTQYSKPARQCCVRLGAALPFGEAATLLRDLTPLGADASMIEHFCHRAGERLEQAAARREDTSAAAPAVAPAHLYVSVDGAHAPIRDAQRPWQEVRVGVVFTTKAGKDGPLLDQREHLAFLGSMDAFAPRLWRTAQRWGALQTPRIIFLSDGAPANWNLADLLFPGAAHVLDFYHAAEHLRAIRDLLFAPDDPDGPVWLERQCHLLKNGHWRAVMDAIAARPPRRGCVRRVRRERDYFIKNRRRMRYRAFRQRGLYIGSGVVESACKQVVTRRIKVSGARWNPATCQTMLALRCAYLSNHDALADAA